MTTASTSSIFSQAASGSPAGIQAWTGELFGELIACGITQTNDTGQLTITGSGGTATTNAAQPSGTGIGNAVGYACFTFNDTLAAGTLSTTALNSGGTLYDGSGTHTYTGITATGATSGATCTCSVTVTGGVCGNMSSIASSGNFIVGEKITIPVASLGNNGGSGANWTATALSSGSPVIFRIDVGAGSAVTDPQAWITLGAGTNGAGTIAGSAGTSKMTQCALGQGIAPLSTSTAYNSYYSYSATTSTCLVAMKSGGTVASCYAISFYIHRSNGSSGAPTATSVSLYTASASTAASSATNYLAGVQQNMTYSSGAGSTVYPTISTSNSTQWGVTPQNPNGTFGMGTTSTLENSTVFVFNGFVMNPAYSYSAFVGFVLPADVANGVTISTTLIGSEALTLIALSGFFGVPSAPFQAGSWNLTAVYQ